jgi:hypothetical protein
MTRKVSDRAFRLRIVTLRYVLVNVFDLLDRHGSMLIRGAAIAYCLHELSQALIAFANK